MSKKHPRDTAWPPLGVRDLKPDTRPTPGAKLDSLAAALKRAGLVSLLILAACSDSERATEVLRDEGYSQIETDGYAMFGCSEHDTVHTSFTARGPSGRRVNGVVCCGLTAIGKGCTVRLR